MESFFDALQVFSVLSDDFDQLCQGALLLDQMLQWQWHAIMK